MNNVLGGIRISTSLQGQPIPIVYGRTRIAPNLVWYDDFFSQKFPTPGLSGSSGQSVGQYDYGAAVILALCQGPIWDTGAIWSGQGNLPTNEISETYTVPGGGGSYTATHQSTYLNDFGVTRGDAYSVTANDFGSPGSIVLTGTQQTPMEEGSVSAGQYTRSGTNGATYNFSGADAGKTMTMTYTYAPPIVSGGTSQDPIVTIGFSFFRGELGQAVWGYLTSKHPAQAIGYSGIAYVATPVLDLGAGGILPNFSFEVYGLLPFGSSLGDSNPADVVYDLLTNTIYGCGIDPSTIASVSLGPIRSASIVGGLGGGPSSGFSVGDLLSVNDGTGGVVRVASTGPLGAIASIALVSPGTDYEGRETGLTVLTGAGVGSPVAMIGVSTYSAYCVANGLFISPALDSVRTAADWIKDILEATNSEIIETGGKLVIVPHGDTTVVANGATFTPNTQPIYDLTVDDFMRSGLTPAVQIERQSVQDAYNAVKVEYLDRGNSYNPSVVEAQDLQAIDAYKYRPEGTRQFHMFTGQAAAAKCAATALARLVYVRNKLKFKLPPKFILLDPMDMATVTVPELGMDKAPVRILSIDEQPDRTLDVTAEEFPWGCSGPTLYPKQSMTPGGANAYAPPGPVNPPIMFEALSRLNNQVGHSIWFGTSGANPNWGGCNIWASIDGGTNYQKIATAIGKTKMGTLTAILASHADPDTLNTLSVDLTQSLGALVSGMMIDADLNALLCYVDGELISYQTATLTAANKYDLTYLRRGVFGSTIGSHGIGSKFMFFDNAVEGWNYDPGFIGTTVHFKFTSFNNSGLVEESLADVTDYTFSITGASIGLLTPAHNTYRATSNPLTAHDAGSTDSINIASFNMRIPGSPDLSFGSGAITGLSRNTLYYVYFDDPAFLSLSAPTYVASATQADALNSAGRFFVGSILTPAAGAPDSIGNNDGGVGAQSGSTLALAFTGFNTQVLGNGAVANAAKAIDGDFATFAAATATGNTGTNQAFLNILDCPPLTLTANKTTTLHVKRAVTNTLNGSGTVGRISLVNIANNTDVADLEIYAPGVGAAVDVISLVITPAMIPLLANGQIQVEAAITTAATQSSGAIEIDIYQAWITIV